MVPLSDQVVVAPEARMDGVLGKLQDGEAGRVLVAMMTRWWESSPLRI
jgi:hypothetical protein